MRLEATSVASTFLMEINIRDLPGFTQDLPKVYPRSTQELSKTYQPQGEDKKSTLIIDRTINLGSILLVG